MLCSCVFSHSLSALHGSWTLFRLSALIFHPQHSSLSPLPAMYHQLQIVSLSFSPSPHIVLEKIHEVYPSKHLSRSSSNPDRLLILSYRSGFFWEIIDSLLMELFLLGSAICSCSKIDGAARETLQTIWSFFLAQPFSTDALVLCAVWKPSLRWNQLTLYNAAVLEIHLFWLSDLRASVSFNTQLTVMAVQIKYSNQHSLYFSSLGYHYSLLNKLYGLHLACFPWPCQNGPEIYILGLRWKTLLYVIRLRKNVPAGNTVGVRLLFTQ